MWWIHRWHTEREEEATRPGPEMPSTTWGCSRQINSEGLEWQSSLRRSCSSACAGLNLGDNSGGLDRQSSSRRSCSSACAILLDQSGTLFQDDVIGIRCTNWSEKLAVPEHKKAGGWIGRRLFLDGRAVPPAFSRITYFSSTVEWLEYLCW